MTPITHVRYVALAVPDLDQERAFLSGVWGLAEVADQHGAIYFAARASEEPYVLRLRQAEQRQVDLFAFAVPTRADVDLLHARARAKNAQVVSTPAELTSPGRGYGFRLFDRDGRLIEVSADVASRTAETLPPNSAVPIGLAHAVFHTPDPHGAVAWYEDVLGLRITDWLDGVMCFLRGGTTKHHCLALLNGPPALNHVSFELENTDALMRGLGRLLKNGVKLNWGPGRHILGDNVFSYLMTPAGNVFEYTAEIEHVPDDWVPRVLPREPEVFDQWGTGRISGPAVYRPVQPDPALWKADAL